MSFDFNHKFWIATNKDINQLIKRQNLLKKLEPSSDPVISYKIFSELYVLYVELVNKLSYIYLHTFQVQKRSIVRELVENTVQQLTSLKNELKNLELSEYVYIDKALIARKLTPCELIIWRSPQFLFRRPVEIQNIVYGNKVLMNEDEKIDYAAKEWVKTNEAILLIQAHERARKARVYKSAIQYDKKNLKLLTRKKVNYTFSFKSGQAMSIPVKRTLFNANFIKDDEQCSYLKRDDAAENEVDEHQLDLIRQKQNKAALAIQTFWRGYKARKLAKMKKSFKRTLYGMKAKRKTVKPGQHTESILEMYRSEMLKAKLDRDFINLITDERTRLLQERSPWIMEDISDHIRGWFLEFYTKTGDFHPYPDPIKRGTVLVVIDETMTPLEFQESLNKKGMSKDEKKKQAEKEKLAKQKEKEKIKKNKMKEAKRRKKMKENGIVDIAYQIESSKQIQTIEATIKQYSIDWRNVDEYLNKNHEAMKEWVTDSELAKVHEELRSLVDEYMRVEFELLRKANAKDLKKKYKPQKVKKAKSKKGKKKKKPKDMTEDRSLQSLYDELKAEGIIEDYPNNTFAKYISDYNFVADDTRDENYLTTIGPAKGDIKMVVQECMLGMGEFNITKPKSLLLIGPINNGKKLLCNIIASELDAVFVNLSPEKIYKFSDRMNYFLHVVMKVAKAFQPTILYINDAHRVFWKKVPPEQKDINPRLLAPAIKKKIMKPIKKQDKIVLLGTSSIPWSAKGKLKKTFQKVILVPICDYGTSFLLWLELMTENAPEEMEDHIYSALAKVLQAYNSGDITDNVSSTLNVLRRMRLQSEALSPYEFLEYFLTKHVPPLFPPEDKLMEKFNKWFSKSNKLSKMRRKFIAMTQEKTSKKKK